MHEMRYADSSCADAQKSLVDRLAAILIMAAILKYCRTSYFHIFLLQIGHHRLHSHSVYSSDYASDMLGKSMSSVIPTGRGGAHH